MRFLIVCLLAGLVAAGCAGITRPDSTDKAIRAFSFVKEGDEAVKKGDIDKAIEKYEKALDLVPDAAKFRFAYSQLLYWKGLTFAQASHRAYHNMLGNVFHDDTGKWEFNASSPGKEEKEELKKQSAEWRHKGLVYFNKSIEQLRYCDAAWDYAIESVPFAMGIVYIFMDEFDLAKKAFERVLLSNRVSEEYRQNINKALRNIDKYQEDLEKRENAPKEDLTVP